MREAETVIARAFILLKQDVKKQIASLDKARDNRTLTKEEEAIVNELKKRHC
jgi:hypothetical protein